MSKPSGGTWAPSVLRRERRGPRNAEQMFPGSSGKSLFGKMSWLTRFCTVWLILVILAAVLADLIPGLPDPNYQGFVFGDGKTNEGPTASHWLGTDNVSRDILARLIYGARVSLIFAFSLVAVGVIVGGTLGSIAGYFRGFLETFLMALVDTWLSFPPLIGLVFITTMLGMRNLLVLCLVGFIFVWPSYTRIARAVALSVSGQDFVTAARAIGTSRKIGRASCRERV